MTALRLDVGRGGAPPFVTANVQAYGHSIAAGGAATRVGTTDFYARLKNTLDPTYFSMRYLGHPSQWTAQMLPQVAADIDAFIDPNKINIFVYLEVINSVSHYMAELGQDKVTAAANALADHMTMFAGRKAAGFQKCIAATMYHPFGFNTLQNDCVDLINAGLRAAVGGGVIDGLVDYAATAEPRFTITGPPGTSLTVSDNTHPTDYGHAIMADRLRPVIKAMYEAGGGPVVNTYSPFSIGDIVCWYEAKASNVTFDVSNKVSLWKDLSSWAYDLTAASTLRPTWNPSNAGYGSMPTIDAAANCMNTALNVDMTYTKNFEIVMLYNCSATSAIMAEFSNNSGSFADTFIVQYHNNSTGPEITTFGNVGNTVVRAPTPITVKSVSLSIDYNLSTQQGKVYSEGVIVPSLVQIDAANTNRFGLRPFNLFARSAGVSPATMSVAALFIFSRILTAPERTALLAYLIGKWPH